MKTPADFLVAHVRDNLSTNRTGRLDVVAARRAQIAELARHGDISADSAIPMGITLDYIAGHLAWDTTEDWRLNGSFNYEIFRHVGQNNPHAAQIDRQRFDRHLKRWLTAHTLLFDVDPATNLLGSIKGLRLTSRPRTAEERARLVDYYKSFDQ